MNDIDKMPVKCRDCPYWELAVYPWYCGDCTNRMKKPAGDFVSRQWLIDEYHRRHQGPPGGALKMIEEAPAADVWPKQRWIPVTERLPEDDTIVLVVSPLYQKPYPAFQIDGVWYDSFLVVCQAAIGMDDEETIDDSGITHWMPLPSTEGLT